MGSVDERQEALALAAQARDVAWAADGTPWQRVLRAISGGRWGRQPTGWTVIRLDAPWQDTPSSERPGWRERAANLAGDVAFAVDYTVCAPCGLGWVEWPYTMEKYQRCGLATAGLEALRLEHPGLSWHTLGGHFQDSRAFWAAVGAGVPGSYQQRDTCPHVPEG
ncbi:hypothetical protein [Streptomyces mirabilis]|uniref:hypothetical protein n=1 Tax=Streptomyces mirabilis TaxID=68239 RepID=UPI00225358C5|nr:hypothetical protein [Streptomyces mirabilis]MCX4425845.1 hypothetical protein [Streptomyces mirabilis]